MSGDMVTGVVLMVACAVPTVVGRRVVVWALTSPVFWVGGFCGWLRVCLSSL